MWIMSLTRGEELREEGVAVVKAKDVVEMSVCVGEEPSDVNRNFGVGT